MSKSEEQGIADAKDKVLEIIDSVRLNTEYGGEGEGEKEDNGGSGDTPSPLPTEEELEKAKKEKVKDEESDGESKGESEDEEELDEDEELDELDDDDNELDEDEADEVHNPVTEKLRSAFPDFEEEDDEEDEDEFYLQKFDESMNQKIISDFHPELHAHNYDEIDVLSRIVRDENGNIVDPLHKTVPFLTRYEKARILGERAKQINSGAKTFVDLEPNVIDGYVIALKEFEAKKIPFIVKRPLPNGGVEYWRFEDLEVLV
jgi:DNA-directed RNA polymerase I, II, and III subunit RPABC2